MVHGYTSESSWLFELTAVAIAKAGFYVCALDLQGHGYSDCIQFFDAARGDHLKLPAFLYGESLGGAIAILVCLKQRSEWNGLILNGAMCGVSKKFKLVWPLEKLLWVVAFIAPTWRIVITQPVGSKSYKEEWKRKLVAMSPNLPMSGKPLAATTLEFLRVSASKDRTSKIFTGMRHKLIGEANESVELVFRTILSWIGERADKVKTNWN
ncbi:hypothetical protein F0562_013706 [Nyssa sinensis]|uniref:Serine aminopeptidase S33 domain-containing protein n=1 Tax=Nyssa sinensis TaxID=561372 RepID=A0A5J4ZN76_9ASTE|nr:hypothetical protein F0562_013706 [Nyssa sinensis]